MLPWVRRAFFRKRRARRRYRPGFAEIRRTARSEILGYRFTLSKKLATRIAIGVRPEYTLGRVPLFARHAVGAQTPANDQNKDFHGALLPIFYQALAISRRLSGGQTSDQNRWYYEDEAWKLKEGAG